MPASAAAGGHDIIRTAHPLCPGVVCSGVVVVPYSERDGSVRGQRPLPPGPEIIRKPRCGAHPDPENRWVCRLILFCRAQSLAQRTKADRGGQLTDLESLAS